MILSEIESINFTLINPKEFKEKASCKITDANLYGYKKDNQSGGPFDLKMGTINEDIKCKSCYNNQEKCPGHFGLLELEEPVLYPHYIQYVKKILNVICFTCRKLQFNVSEEKLNNIKKSKRINYIYKQYVNKNHHQCHHCERNVKLIKYSKDFYYNIENDEGKTEKKILLPRDIIEILKNVSDETCNLIGLNSEYSRPEWLLCEVLVIPPPCIRPYIKVGNSIKNEDDLTYKILEIIKANDKLKEVKKKKKTKEEIYDMIQYLQLHVSTYIDNNMKNVPYTKHKSGRILKLLKDRIKGKTGRIRFNLLGKRVNFSGRSVVSPEPLNNIDELSVPLFICKKLTFPETVNKINYNRLSEIIKRDPETEYPGAEFIIKKKTNSRIYVKFNKNVKLEYGDVVERHLVEGDIIMFNRAPSLMKSNLTTFKIKPSKDKSLKPNPNLCALFNFDFDGKSSQ